MREEIVCAICNQGMPANSNYLHWGKGVAHHDCIQREEYRELWYENMKLGAEHGELKAKVRDMLGALPRACDGDEVWLSRFEELRDEVEAML